MGLLSHLPVRSIRGWLVGSYLLLSLVAVGITGALTVRLVRSEVLRQEQALMQANAEGVARQAQGLMVSASSPEGLARLARMAAFLANARVRILDPQGQVLADSGQPAEAGLAFWAEPAGPGTSEAPPWVSLWLLQSPNPAPRWPSDLRWTRIRQFRGPWGNRFHFEQVPGPFGETEGTPTLARLGPVQVVRAPIGDPASPMGYVEFQVGVEPSVEAAGVAARALTLAGLGAATLAGLLGLVVGEALSRPIRRLAQVAVQMGEGNLSARAPEMDPIEIRHLACELNRMADRLRVTFQALERERDALRRFIADASHQLRTPLTALRTFLELLQGPAAEDPEARAEFLAESQAQVERLAWITQNLLDLSRIEGGLIALDLAPHPVADLIRSAAALFREAAARKGLTLSTALPEEPLEVVCDRWRIEMALSNLLDNAVKFTPPGGRITIGGDREGDAVVLWVVDTGPGIDPQDIPHIFERFYRGRNAPAEGSGLGLAIVRWIAEAHGGRVTVESRPGAGARFTVWLPLRPLHSGDRRSPLERKG